MADMTKFAEEQSSKLLAFLMHKLDISSIDITNEDVRDFPGEELVLVSHFHFGHITLSLVTKEEANELARKDRAGRMH